MPLTVNFSETMQARARRDVKFPQALLAETVQLMLDGNLGEGRAALRSCINATIGFRKAWAGARQIAEEPDADVRTVGQSHGRESARRHRPAPDRDGRSPESARGGRRGLTEGVHRYRVGRAM
jgi:hypothetical protein